MAKKSLTALKTNMSQLNNSGTTELSVMLPVASITLSDDFKELFPLDENKVKEIADNIRQNGFDKSQPLHIWENEGKKVLIDGHTRLAACLLAELYDVPVFMHHFDSVKDAQLYALDLQIKRRNLSSQQILLAIEMYDSIKTTGRKPEGSTEQTGKSSKKLASELGIGERTVEKARAVNRLADEETKDKINSGEVTINQAYENLPEVKARKGSKKKNENEEDYDTSFEALEDNSDNPRSVSFKQRKEKELSPYELKEKEQDSERTEERKKASELGFTDGFLQAANYVLMRIYHGIALEDIYTTVFGKKPEYNKLKKLNGDDPVSDKEYNEFRKSLSDENKEDFNPLPLKAVSKKTGKSKSVSSDIDIDI